ncbi:MAG TPA: hypothetical protein VMT52_08155, partial [Planctomycetota bacterium]|nr:hypothetical protein [Planctomycetota bacterium]
MGRLRWVLSLILGASLILRPSIARGEERSHDPLPGTEPLLWEDDIASRLVAGVDGFLLEEIGASVERRARRWRRDQTSWTAHEKSIEPNRNSLARRLGLRDARPPFEALELVGTTAEPALIGRGSRFEAFAVRWPAVDGVHGEGILLVPLEGRAIADVVAIPGADATPEEIAGLVERLPPASQYARRLAESGCRVLIPMIVSRATGEASWHTRRHGLNHREFLYRPAFELGRHIIGYELQKVLAGVDWFARQGGGSAEIGVMGWGDGGLLALHAAALDVRIDAACVSGYFHPLEDTWMEPIDRNIFGLLEEFGGAELASMVAPRALVIEASQGPETVLPPGTGGGPGRLVTPRLEDVRREVERARDLVPRLEPAATLRLVASGEDGRGLPGSAEALEAFLDALSPGAKLAPPGMAPQLLRRKLDPEGRLRAQILEIDRHTQRLLQESPYVRAELFKDVDTQSLEAFEKSIEAQRERFREDVIGRFDRELLPPRVRSRKFEETAEWTGHEVVMDVFPGVIAYGLLLLPRGVDAGEPRPVVVCQHGLEGRPQHLIGKEGSQHYAAFAARLAERGFITFSPQNLYIFGDRFRTLQRKANLIQKTLFSIIVP